VLLREIVPTIRLFKARPADAVAQPVIFIVELGSVITTAFFRGAHPATTTPWFTGTVALAGYRALRELCGGDRRGPRQASARVSHRRRSFTVVGYGRIEEILHLSSAAATSSSSRRARSFPRTARSSRASVGGRVGHHGSPHR
jgi:hypothetical protein